MRAQSRRRELLTALFLLAVLLLAPPLLIVLVALTVERRDAADELDAADTEPPGRDVSRTTGTATDA